MIDEIKKKTFSRTQAGMCVCYGVLFIFSSLSMLYDPKLLLFFFVSFSIKDYLNFVINFCGCALQSTCLLCISPSFWVLPHLNTGRTTFFSRFQAFCSFFTFFSDFMPEINKKRLKMNKKLCFCLLLKAG